MQLFTIGHATRPIDEFIELLKQRDIQQLVDIRTIPKSRHNPQFGQGQLASSLIEAHIEYIYLAALGGLRPKVKDSRNDAWHNDSFRNYADYMQTDAFADGLGRLLDIASRKNTAIMCAEAVPWRCHRSLVSDALVVRGVKVYEIIGSSQAKLHTLTSFAVVNGTAITYPKSALPEGHA